MIDSHIHIGAFREDYYSFDMVFDTVFNGGLIDKIIYSSTSSCIKSIGYKEIYKEIYAASKKYPTSVAKPLFWVIPDYLKQGLKLESVLEELDYCGFKLHPRGNIWDFENDTKQLNFLHEIFNYASEHAMPIWIHTGESGVDRPARFEHFFGAYPKAKIILAHCRPANETIEVMRKFANAYGDTSFLLSAEANKIKKAGMGQRLIFGTDFPITYYFNKKNVAGLKEQYDMDCTTNM